MFRINQFFIIILNFSHDLYIMNTNVKLLCVGLLVIVLIYCCLGTINLSEGLENSTQTFLPGMELRTNHKDIAQEVQSQGIKHAEKEFNRYQKEIKEEDLGCGRDSSGRLLTPNEYGYCPSAEVIGNLSGVTYDPGKHDAGLLPGVVPSQSHSKAHKHDPKAHKHTKMLPGVTYNPTHTCDSGYIWDQHKGQCVPKLGPGGTQHKHKCRYDEKWNSHKNECIRVCNPDEQWDSYKNECISLCPAGMHWNHKKKICIHGDKDHCPKGKKWSDKKNRCIKKHKNDDDSSSSDDDSDDENSRKRRGHYKHYINDPITGERTFAGSYPESAIKRRYDILPGDEDLYILKSQIVPPVCPACPPVIEGGGCPAACKAKCPPCPPPLPIQPCPPCERCPEPQFQCKKVPDYRNIRSGNLPRPLLNDFSQFT
jgi:hypothetical protein